MLERGRWVFDTDRIDPGATAFFLCNPQNPGGTVFRRAELEALPRPRGLVTTPAGP